MASTYLTRTFSSPTDRKIFTWSAWVKRQNFGITENNNALFSGYLNSNVRSTLRFNTDKLNLQDTEGLVEIITNRLFRDVSAWYHIVVAVDTTQATASNRVKFYVNGEQETSFAQADYPVQNSILLMGGADIHYINARNASGSVDSINDMCYSHIHFTDGTAYDATAFGEYDANGVWKIIVEPSVTYGNNGFFILKDGNSVTDQSGNGNNWTVAGGTLTNTEDSPSNVFATFSSLVPRTSTGSSIIPDFSNGNLSASFPSTPNRNAPSTLAVSEGKYYAEFKMTSATDGDGTFYIGVNCLADYTNGFLGDQMYAYVDDGRKKTLGTYASYGNSYTNNDIIGIAFDATNGTVWFSKNGTWQNSATQTEIENGTTTNAAFTSLDTSKHWNITATGYNGKSCSVNFGNGYFGTTAVSSAGTNASGNGIFEYDVPTGYTALSTTGLNL